MKEKVQWLYAFHPTAWIIFLKVIHATLCWNYISITFHIHTAILKSSMIWPDGMFTAYCEKYASIRYICHGYQSINQFFSFKQQDKKACRALTFFGGWQTETMSCRFFHGRNPTLSALGNFLQWMSHNLTPSRNRFQLSRWKIQETDVYPQSLTALHVVGVGCNEPQERSQLKSAPRYCAKIFDGAELAV